MNKFRNELDKIQLSETEKIKMLNKIKENQKKKPSFATYALRFAVFILAFALFTGAGYAFVKAFIFDDTMQSGFSKTDEELKDLGIEGTDINEQTTYKDATITINQTVYDGMSLYISLDITGTNEALYADSILITEGDTFNEALLKETVLSDGRILRSTGCTSEDAFCEGSWELSNENGKTISYAIDFDNNHNKNIIGKPVTIRIYANNIAYDATFTLGQNNITTKEVEFNTVVYNKNDIIATVKSIKVTPMHLIVNLDYNVDFEMIDEETLEELNHLVYNYNSTSDNKIIYQNGAEEEMSLRWTGDKESASRPAARFDPEKTENASLIDINIVKEVVINGITFNLNEDN